MIYLQIHVFLLLKSFLQSALKSNSFKQLVNCFYALVFRIIIFFSQKHLMSIKTASQKMKPVAFIKEISL